MTMQMYERVEKLIEDATGEIKMLLVKGMTAESYVFPPFNPTKNGSDTVQGFLYFANTVIGDLPQMKLTQLEKDRIIELLVICRDLVLQLEVMNIYTTMSQSLQAAIKTTLAGKLN
jgi:hypothetical protein